MRAARAPDSASFPIRDGHMSTARDALAALQHRRSAAAAARLGVSLAKVEPQTGVIPAKAEFGGGASPRAKSEAATPHR